MRAVQITRFGGPEVLVIVDVPEPTAPERHGPPMLSRNAVSQIVDFDEQP